MVFKWIVGLLIAMLLIDHFWVHYGGKYAEKARSEYREDLKKGLGDAKAVELQQAHRESIIDNIYKTIKNTVQGDKNKQSKEGQ
ncbi:MAG: hypothetical protein ABDH18_05800 [Aquificaceae bacterium]